MTAKYGIIPVLSKKFDLCSMLKQKLGQPCPVKAGTYQNTTRATLPGALPGVSIAFVFLLFRYT